MESGLALSALVVGGAGWLFAMLAARAGNDAADVEPRASRALLAGAVVIIAVLAGLAQAARGTWPAAPRWGGGLLLGGAGALLAAWSMRRSRGAGGDLLRAAAAAAAPAALGVVAAAAAVLWMRAAPADSLAGVAAGWMIVTAALSADPHRRREAVMLAAGAGFAVTLCATAVLGLLRDAAAAEEARWRAAAVALGAGVPLVVLLGAVPASLVRGRWRGRAGPASRAVSAGPAVLAGLISAILLLSLAQVLAARVVGQPRFLYLVALGLASAGLAAWLLAEARRTPPQEESASPLGTIRMDGALPALVVLGATIAAFYLLIGYGVGVMLLAAWLVAGVVLADRMWRRTAGDVDTGAGDAGARPDDAGPAIEETLVRLLLFGLILLLYRLFTSRYQDNLSGAALTDHFALFSFLAGAMLPGLLSRAGAGTGGVTHMGGPAAQVIRFAVAVVLAAGVPAAMLVLWGARSAVGLLAGLAVAAAATEITGAGGAHPAAGRAALRISIMAMLCAVVLTQTAGYAIPLSTLTRAEKTRMLTALAAGVVAVMVLGDIASRIASWTRRKGQGAIHPSPEGAER